MAAFMVSRVHHVLATVHSNRNYHLLVHLGNLGYSQVISLDFRNWVYHRNLGQILF